MTELLRFISCGSVDDGKSTLIGRLLWESRQLFDDQIESLRSDSRRFGTQGDAIDCALLLVDARAGLLTQTRRHAYLVSLLGVRHVLLAVNKMDLVDFDAARFASIREAFEAFASPLGFASIDAVPLSALAGDNVVQRSARTPWYLGPTLMGWLDAVVVTPRVDPRLVFPVQWVNRPDANFRGYSGSVAAGRVALGDTVRVTASGQIAAVTALLGPAGPIGHAEAGDAVCTLACSRALVYDTYAGSKTLGAFILVDRYTHATVAAGMIRHGLRRADNVHRQALSIGRAQRERLGLNRDLGFTEADRVENIRRVAEVARLMADAGLVVLTAFMSPYARERDAARERIGAERFVEVYVDTPLEVCEQRDVKGLYRKARSGALPNMTGIDSPYEAPTQPDFVAHGTDDDIAATVRRLAERVSASAQPAPR